MIQSKNLIELTIESLSTNKSVNNKNFNNFKENNIISKNYDRLKNFFDKF